VHKKIKFVLRMFHWEQTPIVLFQVRWSQNERLQVPHVGKKVFGAFYYPTDHGTARATPVSTSLTSDTWATPAPVSMYCLRYLVPTAIIDRPHPHLRRPGSPDRATRRPSAVPPVLAGPTFWMNGTGPATICSRESYRTCRENRTRLERLAKRAEDRARDDARR
jgi:hypothetical protein